MTNCTIEQKLPNYVSSMKDYIFHTITKLNCNDDGLIKRYRVGRCFSSCYLLFSVQIKYKFFPHAGKCLCLIERSITINLFVSVLLWIW